MARSENKFTESDQNLLSIKTFYESQYLEQGIPIKYICFKIDNKKNIEEPLDEKK